MKDFKLPDDYRPFSDKYFIRSKEILKAEGLNPTVKYQLFIRRADCQVFGINEAIAIIKKYAPSAKIMSLSEGDEIKSCETIITIEAPIQDIIELETMYLGVISAETTMKNSPGTDINLTDIEKRVKDIVELSNPRSVIYMGARHWRYDRDAEISRSCLSGGAKACSTDINGTDGVGTIPHALETIYHWKYGIENAVCYSLIGFDDHIEKDVPRIALIDYANKEILDALYIAVEMRSRGRKLWGVRIDTCGENYMEGVPTEETTETGVSARGVYIVRKALNDAGFEDIKIVLSSGFANPLKIKYFLEMEHKWGIQLFDMLGVGQVFDSRCATGDIVEVEGKPIHKVGRPERQNERLKPV